MFLDDDSDPGFHGASQSTQSAPTQVGGALSPRETRNRNITWGIYAATVGAGMFFVGPLLGAAVGAGVGYVANKLLGKLAMTA